MAKKERVCIVCGNGFIGNAHAETCSPSCRKKLSRMKAKGEKPTFVLVAKSKKKESPLESKVKYVKATPKSYDSPKQNITSDEVGQWKEPNKSTVDYSKCPERKKDVVAWSKWMRQNIWGK